MILTYIKSDLYRYYGTTSFSLFIKAFIKIIQFRYTVFFRCSKSKNKFFSTLSKFFLARMTKFTGIEIPVNTKIGFGLYLSHPTGIIINETAIIGNNCNLSQFTTIGANRGPAAKIGNNVYIGPGCSIIENVTIGDNVTIGAGTIVVKDIEENATSVGNPNKIINYNSPGIFIKNRWSIS